MARIEYVGHATVVVDLDGVRLLTDPLLRNRVAHLRRAVPVDAKALRGIDAVLISHAPPRPSRFFAPGSSCRFTGEPTSRSTSDCEELPTSSTYRRPSSWRLSRRSHRTFRSACFAPARASICRADPRVALGEASLAPARPSAPRPSGSRASCSPSSGWVRRRGGLRPTRGSCSSARSPRRPLCARPP